MIDDDKQAASRELFTQVARQMSRDLEVVLSALEAGIPAPDRIALIVEVDLAPTRVAGAAPPRRPEALE